MNWVFWALILLVLSFIWATFTGAWEKIGDWIEHRVSKMKENTDTTKKEKE